MHFAHAMTLLWSLTITRLAYFYLVIFYHMFSLKFSAPNRMGYCTDIEIIIYTLNSQASSCRVSMNTLCRNPSASLVLHTHLSPAFPLSFPTVQALHLQSNHRHLHYSQQRLAAVYQCSTDQPRLLVFDSDK